jgi:MFS family permease
LSDPTSKAERRPSQKPGGPGRSKKTSSAEAVNRLALARAITFSGGNAAFIALLAALYEVTHSADLVALGALASFAVPALASPVAGWIGDRFDRRKVMVLSEIFGAVCFLLMAVSTTSPTALLVLRVIASLVAAPLMSATAAALPGLVGPAEKLPAANAKLAAAGITGGLVGPLVATVLMLISGPGSVFVFNTATFVVSAALLITITADFRPDRTGRTGGGGSELAAGFRYLGRNHLLRPVTIAYGVLFVGVGLTAPAEVALSADFGVGATGYAALSCIFALGGIAGTRLGRRGLTRLTVAPVAVLAAASGVNGIGFLIVGVAPAFAVALAGMAVSGTTYGLWMVAHENLVQTVTPDAIRSRVFAGSEAVYLGGISLGLVLAGAAISALGAAGTFQISSLTATMGCLLLAGTTISSARRADIEESRLPAPARPAAFASATCDRVSQTVEQGTG